MSNKNNSNVNLVYDKKNKVVVKRNYPKKKLVNEEVENVEKQPLTKKEINRKRYQARQQKYNKNTKKKVMDLDTTTIMVLNNESKDNKKEEVQNKEIKEEKQESNNKEIKDNLDNTIVIKKKDKKEKNNLKKDKEKKKLFVLEEDIPLGCEKENTKIRVKRYLKEALIYSLIITIINLFSMLIFNYVNILHLFDVNILNIIVTVLLSLIISYVVAFFIDCLLTEIWVKIKEKKEGDKNGNSRIIKRKNRRDIQD